MSTIAASGIGKERFTHAEPARVKSVVRLRPWLS
jgi:hypothetical protein